jgi:AraC-like DNA-binding protein
LTEKLNDASFTSPQVVVKDNNYCTSTTNREVSRSSENMTAQQRGLAPPGNTYAAARGGLSFQRRESVSGRAFEPTLGRGDGASISPHVRMLSTNRFYRPQPPLASLVDFFWQSRRYLRPHRAERVLPTGAMDLVIDLTSDSHHCGTLSGARSAFFKIDTSSLRELIGARFKIGGGPVFFKWASGLHDLNISLETLWGSPAVELRDCLAEVAPGASRFALLEHSLLDHLDQKRRPNPAIQHTVLRLQRSHGLVSIGALADECGLSWRRFIEIFRDQVGLTPKLYARLRRFRRAIVRIRSTHEVDWADLAVACGYSDQPHLVREFRAFTGLSPSVYLRHRTSHLNHLRDPD